MREQMLAEFNRDFDSLAAYLRQRTEESAAAGRRVVALPPRPSEPVKPLPTKRC